VQGVLKKRSSSSSVKIKNELIAWLAEHMQNYAADPDQTRKVQIQIVMQTQTT
jgi:hypothetical protein